MATFFNVLTDGSVGCRSCTKCELGLNAALITNCMESTGPKDPVFFVIGHSTGVEDDRIGKPHTGRNGKMFREFLAQAGIPASIVRFGNAIKCHNGAIEPSTKHWKACQSYLESELKECRPKAIITLGAKAFTWLTGYSGLRQFRRRGLPCTLDLTIPVYPFVQPVSILQAENDADARKATTEFISDLLWLKAKADEGSLDNSDDVKTDYKLAETLDDVRAFIAEFEGVEDVCFDLETADKDLNPVFRPLSDCNITLHSFSKGPGHARAIPGRARGRATAWWWTDEEYLEVQRLLTDFYSQDKWWWGHNAASFDRKWIYAKYGIMLKCRYDTEYHHYLIDENLFHGLEGMTLQYTSMPPWKPPTLEVLMKNTVELGRYGCKDVDATSRVRQAMPYDDRQKWLMEQLMIPLSAEYIRVELDGIAIDKENLSRYGTYLEELIEKHLKGVRALEEVQKFELAENVTFNPDAPHHVASIMEHFLHLPKVKETSKGKGYCTDNSVLEHYMADNAFVSHIYFLRKLTKLKGTYWAPIAELVKISPTIHTRIRLDATVTGRTTSADPNLMNQPTPANVARTGITDPDVAQAIFTTRDPITRRLLKGDLGQIELRILASLSQDAAMIQIFKEGKDFHLATAAKVTGKKPEDVTKVERSFAKRVSFAIPYGTSERGIAELFITQQRKTAKEKGLSFGPTEEQASAREAAEFLALHKRNFPGIWSFLERQQRIMSTKGVQQTPFGRLRHYQSSSNRDRRMAMNFLIQSGATDVFYFWMLWAMELIRSAGLDANLVLTVYDSLILDCALKDVPAAAGILRAVVEEALPAAFDWLLVPLVTDIEVGVNLGEMEPCP